MNSFLNCLNADGEVADALIGSNLFETVVDGLRFTFDPALEVLASRVLKVEQLLEPGFWKNIAGDSFRTGTALQFLLRRRRPGKRGSAEEDSAAPD